MLNSFIVFILSKILIKIFNVDGLLDIVVNFVIYNMKVSFGFYFMFLLMYRFFVMLLNIEIRNDRNEVINLKTNITNFSKFSIIYILINYCVYIVFNAYINTFGIDYSLGFMIYIEKLYTLLIYNNIFSIVLILICYTVEKEYKLKN